MLRQLDSLSLNADVVKSPFGVEASESVGVRQATAVIGQDVTAPRGKAPEPTPNKTLVGPSDPTALTDEGDLLTGIGPSLDAPEPAVACGTVIAIDKGQAFKFFSDRALPPATSRARSGPTPPSATVTRPTPSWPRCSRAPATCGASSPS